MITAGVPLIETLVTQSLRPTHRSFVKPLEAITQGLRNGIPFSHSLELAGNWLPSFDRALLSSGAESGRLEICFRLLADYYRQRGEQLGKAISSALYPLIVLHLAVLIFPMSLFTGAILEGKFIEFFISKVMVLGPLYAIGYVIAWAFQSNRPEAWRASLERLTLAVPILGKARSTLALSRLSLALEALLNAGVPVIPAWMQAAESSGSPRLLRRVKSWQRPLESGETPGDLLARASEFPDMFSNLYLTGEVSGQLDTTLGRLHRHYQDEANQRLAALAEWTPRLLYFGIVLWVAWKIISFYSDYFKQIGDVMS